MDQGRGLIKISQVRCAEGHVCMKVVVEELEMFHGASDNDSTHGMTDKAHSIRLFDCLNILLDLDS